MSKIISLRPANNFDVLRILFACFVIISHSYVLSGLGPSDPLGKITNDYVILSYIGVKGFFVISGYLIYQSLMRSSSLFSYLKKRCLRIFPALFVLLIFTLIALFFVSKQGLSVYLSNTEIYKYFFGNFILFMPHFTIPGFFTTIPNNAINGSLWTIEYEFFFYLLIIPLYFTRNHTRFNRIILASAIIAFTICNLFYANQLAQFKKPINGELISDLAVFFLSGSLLSTFNAKSIQFKKIALYIALPLLIATLIIQPHHTFLSFTLSIVIIYFGLLQSTIANKIKNAIGDPSYGIYLYGFFIQQLLIYYFRPSLLVLMTSSILLSIIIGIISWKWIEEKALKLK
jgi:peptidoglycan/LPS O-acetylase OafA/YrhL